MFGRTYSKLDPVAAEANIAPEDLIYVQSKPWNLNLSRRQSQSVEIFTFIFTWELNVSTLNALQHFSLKKP